MNNIRTIFVEKKSGFNLEAKELLHDIIQNLNITALKSIRVLNRYDIGGLTQEEYKKATDLILSEKNVDNVYEEKINIDKEDKVFSVQYLPGQFDQRADSAKQCMQILIAKQQCEILSAKVIVLKGDITEAELQKIKNYCINKVDSREISFEKPSTLSIQSEIPKNVEILNDFNDKNEDELKSFLKEQGLAMSLEDLKFCQEYFKNKENRNPSITEIKVIDTYWSDHCRHTTFQTVIKDVTIEDGKYTKSLKEAYSEYLKSREYVYKDKKKDLCLMDLATIAMKELRKSGKLEDLDVSDEINACSINIDVDVNGKTEKWLLMFKNETHNHPTEIEPFGGAATCIGGAIRDPLSGRTYVYQAMRISGAADPRKSIEETVEGRLPQRKITLGAAEGYSSYGNQIGLATGKVHEIYHEGYTAKRMELGAVIAAAPKGNVVRRAPKKGDIVVLLGGKTGRDGCGGATGSSKEHTESSIKTCSSEVQKGNAPTERKLQRLFRNPSVSKLIVRCNDFGAGGVSVAIGELSEGLNINLDLVPKKYDGLDGTELAISESQERMAVVIENENKDKFLQYAKEENLEATVVAEVTDDRRLKMLWRDNAIVDLSRDFLDTNGVKQITDVKVSAPSEKEEYFGKAKREVENTKDLKKVWNSILQNLNVCSQKGLVERFDSSIGAGTILMPYGGKYQLSPQEGMAAKVSLVEGETNTASIMTFGYNPNLATWSPFHGGVYSVIEAMTKNVCLGGDYKKIRLTMQEYFERLGSDSEKWGKPFSALVGAYYMQKNFDIPAIGGKDSMSGSFKDMNVPPTIVTFAVNTEKAGNIVSTELKKQGSKVILIPHIRKEDNMPNVDLLKKNFEKVHELIVNGKVLASTSVKAFGICEALTKMCFGNHIGVDIKENLSVEDLTSPDYGSIILEIDENADLKELEGINYINLGNTIKEYEIRVNGETIDLANAEENWKEPLESVFKTKTDVIDKTIEEKLYFEENKVSPIIKVAKPKVFIPVFPGTNCEYDTKRAFERAGAEAEIMVFRNQNGKDIEESIDAMANKIKESQIVMIPGGFSAGDEPDGSGKFITAVFRNPKVSSSVMELLKNRDGLMLGICNGFQALIKLGLVPFGEIREMDEKSPTLTFNNIGRHVSRMVDTKIVSNKSPWFSTMNVGDVHTIPVSHGEGKFVASEEVVKQLLKNGQIATQYVDFAGKPTYDIEFNPNGSVYAVEGITSPDGRVLGKMGHSERYGENISKNITGNKYQSLFESGVNYFK